MDGNTAAIITARSRMAVELISAFVGQLNRVRHHLDRLHQSIQDFDDISAEGLVSQNLRRRQAALGESAKQGKELDLTLRTLSAAISGYIARSRSQSPGSRTLTPDITSPAQLLAAIALHLRSRSRLNHCVLHNAVFQITVMDNARSVILSPFFAACERSALDARYTRTSTDCASESKHGVDADTTSPGSFAAPRNYTQYLLEKAAARMSVYLAQDKTPLDLLNPKIFDRTRRLYCEKLPTTLSVTYSRLRQYDNLPFLYANVLARDGSCNSHPCWLIGERRQPVLHWTRSDREREEWDEFIEEQGEQVTGGISAYKTLIRLNQWFIAILKYYEQHEDQGDTLINDLCVCIYNAIKMYKEARKTCIIKSFCSPIMICMGTMDNGQKDWQFVLRGGALHPRMVLFFASLVRHWLDVKMDTCFMHQAVFEIAVRDNMEMHVLYRKKLEGESRSDGDIHSMMTAENLKESR